MDSTPVQLSALAVLGTAFLLVLRWMLNQMTSKLSDVANAIRAHSLVQLDMHKTLIKHDAQVRGVNPSVGDDATEAHERAAGEYSGILSTLENTAETIKLAMTNRQAIGG